MRGDPAPPATSTERARRSHRALGVVGAMLLVQAEQYDAAIGTADGALAKNPDDAWAAFAKALALAAKKDPGAGAAFEATVAKAPTAPIFYFEGAAALLMRQPGADALLHGVFAGQHGLEGGDALGDVRRVDRMDRGGVGFAGDADGVGHDGPVKDRGCSSGRSRGGRYRPSARTAGRSHGAGTGPAPHPCR